MAKTNRDQSMFPLALGVMAAALTLGAAAPPSGAQPLEFDEFFVGIKINATEGGAAFRGKTDGPPAKEVEILNPDAQVIHGALAQQSLLEQGIAKNAFKSAYTNCADLPLRDLLARFPAGPYTAQGETNDGMDMLAGAYEFEHMLPAAPDISDSDNGFYLVDGPPVVLEWSEGVDLGECSDVTLVEDNTIPDPSLVDVEAWEVVVKPEDEEAAAASGLPTNVFKVRLPAKQTSVTVPYEFLLACVDAGLTDFQFEVRSIYGANVTTSAGAFQTFLPTGDDGDDGGDNGENGGGLVGQDTTLTWNFPDKTDASILETAMAQVGSGVEYPGFFFGFTDYDVSSNQVTIEFNSAAGLVAEAFNGPILTLESPLTSATINAATTLPGVTQDDITIDGNKLCIDLGGTMLDPSFVVVIDVD